MRILKILGLFAVLAVPLVSIAEPRDEPGPFSSKYQTAKWGAPDFWLFVLGAGSCWRSKGEWPKTMTEIESGIMFWVDTLKGSEREKVESQWTRIFVTKFEIKEIINMRNGITYRLRYSFGEEFVDGIVVLQEQESVEAVAQSALYSSEFGSIAYSVPF